ncbi:hypothetical protein Dimus_037003, partial [Dionaea muscipula]
SSIGKNQTKHPLESSGPLLLGCRRRPPPPEAHKAGKHPATASGPRGGDDGQSRVNRAETIFGEIQGFNPRLARWWPVGCHWSVTILACPRRRYRTPVRRLTWVEAAAVGGTSDGAGKPVGTVGASLVSDSSGWWLPEDTTLSTALKESKHVYISISCNGSHLTFAKDPVRNYLPLRSHGLSRLGVSKGDVLLIVAPNLIHFPLCFLGTTALGAIASSSTVNEITKKARYCKPKLLVTVPEPWEKVKGLDLPAVILGPVEDRNLLSIVLVMRLGV